MKSFKIGVTLLAILLLSTGGFFAHFAASNSSDPLSINLSGIVTNAQSQQYFINQSGIDLSASVLNYMISSSQLNYTLDANVTGQTVTGNASFDLHGTLAGGGAISVSSGFVPIIGMVAAECLPNYDTPNAAGTCETNDTSAIPAFFVGMATIQINSTLGNTTLTDEEMLFESAYLNPFGGPIVLCSNDSSITIVTPYTQATISWTNVMNEGTISGSLGSTPISGNFAELAFEQEDLVSGTSTDWGTMTFSNVTDSYGNPVPLLDATGPFAGNSSIPMAGSYDCSTTLGFPAGSGVCTETGYESSGNFSLAGQFDNIGGSYASTWSVPAWEFSGNAAAAITETDPSSPAVNGSVIWYTPNYAGVQVIYPASIAINGVPFSATFYESLTAQYQPVAGLPYAGYYSGTFGAISGCQPGATITITATLNGVTESASSFCPPAGGTLSISLVFGAPS